MARVGNGCKALGGCLLICTSCNSSLREDRQRCICCGEVRPATGWGHESWSGTVILDRYEVVQRIGAGATGAAYKSRDRRAAPGSPHHVVVKFLHGRQVDNAETLARFRVEALAGSLVKHPGVAGTLAFAESARVAVLVREFVRGRSLAARLREEGPLPLQDAVDCAAAIARTLGACHAVGVVHRDVKPQNIYLEEDPFGGERPRLLDFGFAQVRLPHGAILGLTASGVIVGSPAYMAPEQTRSGVVDGRADLYALGIVLYRMISGERPLLARTIGEQIRLQRTVRPIPLRRAAPRRGVSKALEGVVMRLLEKDPGRRFRDAGEVVQALAAVRPADEPSAARTRVGARRPPADVSQSGLFALPRLDTLNLLRRM